MKIIWMIALILSCGNVEANQRINKSLDSSLGFHLLGHLGCIDYVRGNNSLKTVSDDVTYAIRSGSKKYEQTHGKEKIKVRFPTNPVTAADNGSTYTFAIGEQAVYSVVAPLIPIADIQVEQTFDAVLKMLSSPPFGLVNYEVSTRKKKHYLDVETQNMITGMFSKIRVIITPFNYYILETHYLPEGKEKHESFIGHFSIK